MVETPLPSIDVADALLDERRELTGLPRLTRCLGNYYVELLAIVKRSRLGKPSPALLRPAARRGRRDAAGEA